MWIGVDVEPDVEAYAAVGIAERHRWSMGWAWAGCGWPGCMVSGGLALGGRER
jgi:hypothetical protein